MKRKISINDLKVGFILEEDIKTADGKILIGKGTVLTQSLIVRLRQWNAKSNCMLIVDDGIKNPETYESLENHEKSDELQNKIVSSLENVFEAPLEKLSVALADLESYIAHIYDDLKTIEDLPDDVTRIKYANGRGGHYFRMAKMAVALASIYNRGVSEDKQLSLSSVALATLLHDYGMRFKNDSESLSKLKIDKTDYDTNVMLSIPYKDEHNSVYSRLKIKDMINGPYNDRYHSTYAYVALKDKVPEEVRNVILYSSCTKEAFQNIRFSKVVKAANIIAICDAYDTLLEYVIREDMSNPFENVISYMGQLAKENILDNELYKLFLSHIPIYPIGEKVLLSNDQYAVVVKKSEEFPTKPLVLTLPPSIPTLIDLTEVTNITIRRIVKTEEKASDKVDAIQAEQLNGVVEHRDEDIIPEGSTPGTLVLKKVK